MREEYQHVSLIYADALYKAACQSGGLDAFCEEAYALRNILRQNPGVLRLLERPAIHKDEKEAFLRRTFEGRISPLAFHLALLLVDKHRGGLWLDVLDCFILTMEERKGVHAAEIQTARPLGPDNREHLIQALEARFDKRLHIAFRENPKLLGGILFRCGDVMIDSTIRGFLNELRGRLSKVKID